jgi:hypothetical protein
VSVWELPAGGTTQADVVGLVVDGVAFFDSIPLDELWNRVQAAAASSRSRS